MRIVLKLITDDNFLAINYNYPLSAAVYKLLRISSTEFAEFLHSVGYKLDSKTYKLFTFSLKFRYSKIEGDFFHLSSKEALLYISSPLIDDFLNNIIIGSLLKGKLEIVQGNIFTSFLIEHIEEIPEPAFNNNADFMLLSPIVLSTKIERYGKLTTHYFEYYEDINEINRVFNRNLMNKYELIYNKQYKGEPLKFRWLDSYIQKQLQRKRSLKRLIKIEKKGIHTINVIANNIPFNLEGSAELMRVGFQTGFGEKNSLGFGMAQMLR